MIKNKKCFVCEKGLDRFEGVVMLGLDTPYVNLWFHKSCMDKQTNLLEYLTSKTDKIRKEMPNYR